MSRLESLIEELCPLGVEYLNINDIANFRNGKGHEKVISSNGDYIVVNSKFISTNGSVIKKSNEQLTPLYKNEILLVMSDLPNGKALGRCFLVEEDNKYTLNQRICAITVKNDHKINPKFLYYILDRNKQFLKYDNGIDQTNLKKDDILKVKIPIPPIKVQQEIVCILENFIEMMEQLTAELRAEITARINQYEYYRDELLAFKDKDVEWKTLAEISTEMYRGAGIKRDQVTVDGIPCVRYGEIYTAYDISFEKCISYTTESEIKSKKYFENGDILFAITGESVEAISKSIAYLGNEKCMAGGDIVVMKHNQNPRYLAYALSTVNAQKQKSKGKVKSKVVHSSVPSLKEIVVPIPSLEEQDRIEKILVSMDNLCKDISTSIKSEIEVRRKQYEFYREKLLTFKKLEK